MFASISIKKQQRQRNSYVFTNGFSALDERPDYRVCDGSDSVFWSVSLTSENDVYLASQIAKSAQGLSLK